MTDFAARNAVELAAVAASQTSVALPEQGSIEPAVVNERLSADVDPEINLTYVDSHYLALMEAEIRRLDDHDLLVGLAEITDDPGDFEHDLKERASGLYDTRRKALYVAPEEVVGEVPRERETQEGYFATDSNFGSMWHEAGHHRLRVENPREDFGESWGQDVWRDVDEDHVRQEVSEYAATDRMEFVAEVFSGKMAGEDYSERVEDAYARLGGPEVPASARDPETAFEARAAVQAAAGGAGAGVPAKVQAQTNASTLAERLRSLGGVDSAEVFDWETEDVIDVKFRGMERPSVFVIEDGAITEFSIRLPPLDQSFVRENRDQITPALFRIFRDANRKGVLPQDTHIHIAGPNGQTPHIEGGPIFASDGDVQSVVRGLYDGYAAEFSEQFTEDELGQVRPRTSAIGDYTYNGLRAREDVPEELIEVVETGVFDDGAVVTDTRPVEDYGNWQSEPGISQNAIGINAQVSMPVEDFRDLQEYIGVELGPHRSEWMFWDEAGFEENIEEYTGILRGEREPGEYYDGLAHPWVEIGNDGTLRTTQEGRHRAKAALRAGLDRMPVTIIYNRSSAGEGGVEEARVQARSAVADRIANRLRRMDTANVKITQDVGGKVVIDFAWMDDQEIEGWEQLFNSSIVVEDGEVTDAFLRMPPVPVDGWDMQKLKRDFQTFEDDIGRVKGRVRDVLGRTDPPVSWTLAGRIGHSNTGPTPHINFHFRDPKGDYGPDTFLSFLQRFKDAYAREFPRTEFGTHRYDEFMREAPAIPGEAHGPPELRGDPIVPERITNEVGAGGVGEGHGPVPWHVWDGRPTDGVSGLWFPDERWMVVSNRTQAHHHQQVARLINKHFDGDRFALPERAMPWAVEFVQSDGEWKAYMDMPASAGGLSQVVNKNGLDMKPLNQGYQIQESWFWPVAYTAKLLGLPDETDVTLQVPGDGIEETYAETFEFALGDAYRELSFDGALPEPEVDRSSLSFLPPEWERETARVQAAALDDVHVVGPEDPPRSVEHFAEELLDWGATDMSLSFGRGRWMVEFRTPYPGEQPIRSSVTVVDGRVVKATMRYGVLDSMLVDHGDTEALGRLHRAVRRHGLPGGASIAANFGDETYPPRPHVLVGWTPTAATGFDEATIMQEGDSADVRTDAFLDYAKGWGKQIASEFQNEFDHEHVEHRTLAQTDEFADHAVQQVARQVQRVAGGEADVAEAGEGKKAVHFTIDPWMDPNEHKMPSALVVTDDREPEVLDVTLRYPGLGANHEEDLLQWQVDVAAVAGEDWDAHFGKPPHGTPHARYTGETPLDVSDVLGIIDELRERRAMLDGDEEARVSDADVEWVKKRLRDLGATDLSSYDVGNATTVDFDLPDARHGESEMPSSIQLDRNGLAEATLRLPELQEASQAGRGVLNRFPDLVESLNPPGTRFVAEGFEGHEDDLQRGELRARTRINDLYDSQFIRPHVHFDAGAMKSFDPDDVLDFIERLVPAYEEEFAPYAPRDDLAAMQFNSSASNTSSMNVGDSVRGRVNAAVEGRSKNRPQPKLWDPIRKDIADFYHENEQKYQAIWAKLKQVRDTWERANHEERVALLKTSYILSVLSIQVPWERAQEGFLMIMDDSRYGKAWVDSGVGHTSTKMLNSMETLAKRDVWHEVVDLLEDGYVDAAHDRLLDDDVKWLGDAKAPFTLANLGFTEKMCLDANVIRVLDTDTPGGLERDEYDEVCREIEGFFPDLSEELASYELQWVLFDYQRFYLLHRDRGTPSAETRSEAAQDHPVWFDYALGDLGFLVEHTDRISQWCRENYFEYERAYAQDRHFDEHEIPEDQPVSETGEIQTRHARTFNPEGGHTEPMDVESQVRGRVQAAAEADSGPELDTAAGTGQAVNDREFSIIVPKADNSGNPIKPEVLENIAHRVSERFGGVTVYPSVAGCFIPEEGEHEGELMCEENAVITTVRDSADGVAYSKDEKWLEQLAEDVAEDLGQFSVMTAEDKTEVEFVPGEYMSELGPDKTGKSVFAELL